MSVLLFMRRVATVVAAPFMVIGMMLAGTILFQMMLYWRYGDSIFDSIDMPGYEFAYFQTSSAIVRWPAQLIARALHLWVVQVNDAIAVVGIGTLGIWLWLAFSCPRGKNAWRKATANFGGQTTD